MHTRICIPVCMHRRACMMHCMRMGAHTWSPKRACMMHCMRTCVRIRALACACTRIHMPHTSRAYADNDADAATDHDAAADTGPCAGADAIICTQRCEPARLLLPVTHAQSRSYECRSRIRSHLRTRTLSNIPAHTHLRAHMYMHTRICIHIDAHV
jgi:hypothetical protein